MLHSVCPSASRTRKKQPLCKRCWYCLTRYLDSLEFPSSHWVLAKFSCKQHVELMWVDMPFSIIQQKLCILFNQLINPFRSFPLYPNIQTADSNQWGRSFLRTCLYLLQPHRCSRQAEFTCFSLQGGRFLAWLQIQILEHVISQIHSNPKKLYNCRTYIDIYRYIHIYYIYVYIIYIHMSSFHHVSALDSVIHVKLGVNCPSAPCQMLGMLHADAVASAEVLVHVITNIEGECPIQLQEHYDPGVCWFEFCDESEMDGLNVCFFVIWWKTSFNKRIQIEIQEGPMPDRLRKWSC